MRNDCIFCEIVDGEAAQSPVYDAAIRGAWS